MPPSARRTIENQCYRLGFCRVAGTDEVGRGCLAGPVVAGVVVLGPVRRVSGLRDSKLTTPAQRERLYEEILQSGAAWAVCVSEPAEIDALNIHRASLDAMRRAILALNPLPDLVLVDAFRIPNLLIAQRGVVHGDRVCTAIAAASIVAKVTRDRLMVDLHNRDPRYGFDQHKGYATPQHLAAVARYGYSEAHRRSFRPPTLFDKLGADFALNDRGQ